MCCCQINSAQQQHVTVADGYVQLSLILADRPTQQQPSPSAGLSTLQMLTTLPERHCRLRCSSGDVTGAAEQLVVFFIYLACSGFSCEATAAGAHEAPEQHFRWCCSGGRPCLHGLLPLVTLVQ